MTACDPAAREARSERRTRIVQIECFYSQFLDDFYAARPALAQRPFAEQIDVLLDSGFSGGHNTVPALNPQHWNTHYLVPNCAASQAQWAREHGVDPTACSPGQILEAQLRSLDPDVLYLSDIPGFDFQILQRLPRRPFVVGWHASIVDPRIAWDRIDLVLSGIRHIRDAARALGARAVATFMPAAPPYRNPARESDAQRLDLVFSGSFSGRIHHERLVQYKSLARELGEHRLSLYTPAAFPVEPGERIDVLPPVFGRDVMSLYATARIVLDSRGDFLLDDQGERETSNMRIFEATRAGALLLTEDCRNLGEYFDPQHEIVTYRDTADLVDKVRFYLDPRNAAARRSIAAAGFARATREHLLEHRAAWLERILREHLADRGTAPAANLATGDMQAHRQVLCTSAGADDVLFALHAVQRLRSLLPELPLLVLCRDAVARRILARVLPQDRLLDLAALPGPVPEQARALPPALQPWIVPPRLLLAASRLYPQARRLSYLHPTVLVREARALHAIAADDAVCVLAHGLEPQYRYEAALLGAAAMDLLSVPNDDTGQRLLDALAGVDAQCDSEAALAARLPRCLGALREGGAPVHHLAADTPWNFGHQAGASGLFLFSLVRRLARNNYQLLSFGAQDSWQRCYDEVYLPCLGQLEALWDAHLASDDLAAQTLCNVDARLPQLLLRHQQLAQQGYRLLTEQEYAASQASIEGWNTAQAAQAQHQAFEHLIGQFRAGSRRADLLALQKILGKIRHPGLRLLETGCGSGYIGAFIAEAVDDDIDYSGVDLAPAMVALARATYPRHRFAVMSASQLEFERGSFDVVLNGAALMHTIDYEQAIAEAARVAREFAVFHTVTVVDAPENIYFSKNGYGSPVVEVCFSESVLAGLLERNHLQPVLMEPSIDYDLAQVVGRGTRSLSIACLRTEPPAPDAVNHYCAYFDSNYLTRAVLMVESLRRHDPNAHFHLLCLDATAEEFFRSYAPHVTPIGIAALEAADPEFAACRHNRSLVEWYFTATSVLCHHLLRAHPQIGRLTYLDSDLYFYASPAVLHAESKGKSVQIIEHRFSPHLRSMERYGRFNVAWISFFNSEEGLRVLQDYRADCIAWCYDRLEDDRFADQKYLDRWPGRYPNCCVSRWIGADVAHWNVSQWELGSFDGQLYVGGERLIFYHFQGIKLQPSGTYWAGAPPEHFGRYFEPLYAPYLAAMDAMEQRLQPVLRDVRRTSIRYAE